MVETRSPSRGQKMKQGRSALILAALLLGTLTSCGNLGTKLLPPPKEKGTGFDEEKPLAKVIVLAATPPLALELVREADDPATAFKGKRQVANGCLSLGFKDGRKHWQRGFECGGRLIMSGNPDEQGALDVTNERDETLDLRITHNGQPLPGGDVRLAPHESKRIPLTWSSVSGVEALARYDVSAQQGALSLTPYRVPGAKKRLNDRTTKLPAAAGPQRRYEPLALPFEYR